VWLIVFYLSKAFQVIFGAHIYRIDSSYLSKLYDCAISFSQEFFWIQATINLRIIEYLSMSGRPILVIRIKRNAMM
jgi:hypothetical protein